MTRTLEEGKENESKDVFIQSLESTSRIALAGFGGALVGLALARKQVTPLKPSGRALIARGRRYTNQELSRRWAVSCLAFATIFEATRLIAPCSFFDFSSPYNKQFQVIGDYSIAGAIAGFALRGMPIQTFGKKMMGSNQTPRLGAGMAAGLVLGFIPGVLVAGLTFLEDQLEIDNAQETVQRKQADLLLSTENRKVREEEE